VAEFAAVEVSLLAQFLDELDALVQEPDLTDPLAQRLFPAGYRDDPDAAADFRSLTQLSLAQERRDRYACCRRELPPGGGRLAFDADSANRWLLVLNDMRLALGTRLGVTADGFAESADEDQEQGARIAYHWLTAMQDGLVGRLSN
jgi:hypothetical protein